MPSKRSRPVNGIYTASCTMQSSACRQTECNNVNGGGFKSKRGRCGYYDDPDTATNDDNYVFPAGRLGLARFGASLRKCQSGLAEKHILHDQVFGCWSLGNCDLVLCCEFWNMTNMLFGHGMSEAYAWT